jgi:5'-phosphate synthase pdxT subunit
VFIRAPWIESHGEQVELLAEIEGHPIAAREHNILAVAFHPELTDDLRLHALFLALVDDRDQMPAHGGRRPARGRSKA